jgi:hypothetical protein
MAYFKDLTEYSYFHSGKRPNTKNTGWLAREYPFEKELPNSRTLDLLWSLSAVMVVATRGRHLCDLCEPHSLITAERNDISITLGSSEARIFSRQNEVYAAPSLIYHYVNTHHYKPPDEFLRALAEVPTPPAVEYFDRLKSLGLEWKLASQFDIKLRADQISKGFRFKSETSVVEREEVHIHTYHDRDH